MSALALPFLAVAAAAGADPVTFDVQCVIVTQTAMEDQTVKPELKAMLMSAVTYFSGRVDAETSAADLEIGSWPRRRRSRASLLVHS